MCPLYLTESPFSEIHIPMSLETIVYLKEPDTSSAPLICPALDQAGSKRIGKIFEHR